MDRIFNHKIALVTGAAKGIGQATARAFAERGAKVILSDVDDSAGRLATKELQEEALLAEFMPCDVSKHEQVAEMMGSIASKYGALDFAFNNAGIEGEQAPTDACSLENWQRVIDINLNGVFYCMKYQLPLMIARGGGRIINCSSTAGRVGFAAIPAYNASKHGVIGLSKSASLSYAQQGIRVNSICPGVIYTSMIDRFSGGSEEGLQAMREMQPVGRMGKPVEIANTVMWLCSPEADFVTGQEITVDGGYTTG